MKYSYIVMLGFFCFRERGYIMGYRFDIAHLTGQQQAIIRQRDKENLLHTSNTPSIKKKEIHPLKIFMKLGFDSTAQSNGRQTLDIYKQFADSKGAVWFSTDSHTKGMGKAKKNEFINAIKSGKVVEMYFAISKTSDGENKMIAIAEVQDIISEKDGTMTPDSQLTPEQWKTDKNKIWLKITHITYLEHVDCNDFIVASSGRNLMDIISISQHHFGYIKHI